MFIQVYWPDSNLVNVGGPAVPLGPQTSPALLATLRRNVSVSRSSVRTATNFTDLRVLDASESVPFNPKIADARRLECYTIMSKMKIKVDRSVGELCEAQQSRQ